MTTSGYYTAIKDRYPNTFIGLNCFYIEHCCKTLEAKSSGFSGIIVAPMDYMLTIIIRYIEHRGVDFLTAMCNTSFDLVPENHEALRLMTVTHILNRLEKFIEPAEGQVF